VKKSGFSRQFLCGAAPLPHGELRKRNFDRRKRWKHLPVNAHGVIFDREKSQRFPIPNGDSDWLSGQFDNLFLHDPSPYPGPERGAARLVPALNVVISKHSAHSTGDCENEVRV
jgi:hypothetical protein